MSNRIIDFLKSRSILILIAVLFECALLAGAFSSGLLIGFRKANFSYAWGEHYDSNFGGPKHGLFGFREGPQFMDAHGTFGQIILIDEYSSSRVSTTRLTIKGRDNREKIVLVDPLTSIERMRKAVSLNNLSVDDNIVVIGEPNEWGQIEAKFIRVMP